ncbi:transcription elongation factor A N-terminal and central domain-containing protein 2-like [Macrobrachium nipponense]|uniref:transcription elongation factor A N-terminal and central domain-containing protein 2-like n=1 Tax=Macrobrachium nipponense TaxID=159736 RepID=UPI0030C8A364
MDKFVIRTPRNSPNASPVKKKESRMKQATIESLTGVVIIEVLERAKVVLERSDVTEELKLDTLESLKRKNPAKEILVKTGIGKTVHKLCKDKNEKIAAMAKEVYLKWKENVLSKVNRPLIEVQCDQKTQNFRRIARQMILGSLRTKHSMGDEEKSKEKKKKSKGESSTSKKDCDDTLAEFIEREVYQTTNRKCNNSYRRTIRKLVFTLRHNHELRSSVLDSSVTVTDFVKDHLQA